jgi:MoxR-like ATPase
MRDPSKYLADEGLVDAVNVALLLQQPLLLTGEPGTGKTQLAFSVAWELGLGAPLTFETKSTSVARDLFYSFDSLRRFQAAQQPGQDLDPRAFITFNALGLAILRTMSTAEVREILTNVEAGHRPHRSLVLIDEVDKAPRDFPNDILSEIDDLYFRVPEMNGQLIRANIDLRPIVIITSNSEKSLPDAFLRRCIFYHIPFPGEDRLEEIVANRVAGLGSSRGGALSEALSFFSILREDSTGLRKKPGTAELLNWATALGGIGIDPPSTLKSQAAKTSRTLTTLAKHPEDQVRVFDLFGAWVHG